MRSPRKRFDGRTLAGVGAAVAVAVAATGVLVTRTVARPGVSDVVLEGFGTGSPPVRLASFEGRPLVVNFFASWCLPCVAEMPEFGEVHRQVGDRVAFLGVDVRDDGEAAARLVRSTRVTYPLASDPLGEGLIALGGIGMPTTLFVSPGGRVLERHTGPMSGRELRGRLARHFGL